MVLPTVLSMIHYVSGHNVRDFVDRLHSVFTSNILIGFAILVSFKQFGGRPIECLTPDVFSGSWEEYAEMFCFTQETYYVPFSQVVEAIPTTERAIRKISYYQWVPFFLILQAAAFRIPSLIWKYMSDYSGIKLDEVLKMALDENNVKPDIKQANIKALSMHLQGALRFHRRLQKKHLQPHRFFCMFNLPYSRCYVTMMFLFTRLMCILNVFAQLYAMNLFLETSSYQFYGFGAIMDVVRGKNWEKSGLFPRSTLCDFEVRVMGNIQKHTIQCVLLINLLNEKIFVFLWFWYLFLLFLTTASFLFWLLTSILPCVNNQFIRRHLEMTDISAESYERSRSIKNFVSKYLRMDGVFVVRTLIFQAGVIFGAELLSDIWRSYMGIEEQLKKDSLPAGMTLAQEDQSEYENKKNYLRQRRFRKPATTPDTSFFPNYEFDQSKLDDNLHYAENRLYPPNYSQIQSRPPSTMYTETPPTEVLKAFNDNQKIINDFNKYLENNNNQPRQGEPSHQNQNFVRHVDSESSI